MKEYYCLKCGSKMFMTQAIGLFPIASVYFDYESESLYECLNKDCNMEYYFMDHLPYPYFVGRLI